MKEDENPKINNGLDAWIASSPFMKGAIIKHLEEDHGIWYTGDLESDEPIAAVSTVEKDGKLFVSFAASPKEYPYMGLQMLKAAAEYALEKKLQINLFATTDSLGYYLRLGFKKVDTNQTVQIELQIDPEDLLKQPDYFEDKD